jgi:UDP-glucose 4-epimerase
VKILVTGGAGFIGSHIADAYLAAGHEVSILDWEAAKKPYNIPTRAAVHNLDINSPEVERVFKEGRFDILNHHAAQMSVPVSVKDPILDATTNILGVLRLLQYSSATGVKKVIFASSGGTVYGVTDRIPSTEDLPFDAASPYGVSKVATELYLRTWSLNHGLRFTALRYANVYGPRQDAHGESGVVAIFVERMLQDGAITIHGDGEHTRDYVYVGDVARASVAALTQGDGEGINIGTGVESSTNTLFRTLKALTGAATPETHGPARPGDVRRSCLAWDKAQRVLGWEPKVALKEGLGLTVDWFRGKTGKT